MKKVFENYIQSISSKFSHDETSEMGYRTDFEILIKEIFESVNVRRIDHDAKARQGNKPDFIVLNHNVPILYIEAKDIGVSLDKIEKSEQMDRYYGYTNLILTDYMEFRFYRNGLRYEESIKIADYDIKNKTAISIPENYLRLAKTIVDFTQSQKEPIRSGKHLSKIMGGKAQRIRDNIRQFYSSESDKNSDLIKLYETIKKLLVHDLEIDSFADMYAQTLVYGLFVARFYDKSLGGFSRQEARELIPNSNPLLRHFFDHIVGADFDIRLKYIVDELCEVFSHANIEELMKEYFKTDLWGKTHKSPDPVIHFYEDFLDEYDPILRKKMGAYYTPLPVVQFIISSVDHLLKNEFGLTAGLADISKTKDGIHKVQVLDPAVGTGTFISAVIRIIYERLLKSGQKGRWPAYVHHDLLPRIYGFELMMAPYTIAHLKLGIAFRQTGFWDFHRRLGIYLTNSLEESVKQQEMFSFGLAESIAEESKEASIIKNEKPIMVVIGNPPYSGISSNETDFANNLVEKYKVEPGGKQKLQERKHWLNDDYVKFIALAEKMVEKNGEGIIGLITNNGYLDNPTFRGMRWHIMNTFNEIYVLDLHGNVKKKEVSPNGSKDENVFDIQQGVAIVLAIKKKPNKNELAKIYRYDLWGKRESKFEHLNNTLIENIKWVLLDPRMPNLSFVHHGPQNREKDYELGFRVNELFPVSVTGVVTMGDDFIVDDNKNVLQRRVEDFLVEDVSENELKRKYHLGKNYAKWIIENKGEITGDETKIISFAYRPFDIRYTYFDNKLVWRPRTSVMKHLLSGDNIALEGCRQVIGSHWSHIFLTNNIVDDSYVSNRTRERGYTFPLYLHVNDGAQVPNLKKEIVDEIEKLVGKVTPEDIFDYIYAILHAPSYREKYREFLKIDFPRVPYPKDARSFKKLVTFGTELRSLHLLESPKVNEFITAYPITGSDIVEKPTYKDGKVYINEKQYFGNVPELAWNFYIGGYLPAQKWLKDRKGRTLVNADIEHYQKIIVVLMETGRIMKKIDEVILE